MYESLRKHCKDFHLYIFPFNDDCEKALFQMHLPNVTIVPLREFEDEELLRLKPTRSRIEYFWTCTPSIILYCLKKYGLTECTYVDADVYFFGSPEILLDELGSNSILITDHRYTRCYDQSKRSGKYCVQFVTFKSDKRGFKALEWWRNACNEWCYVRHERGKFGDQKYLDDWPTRFEGVHVLQHLGGGMAPWNIQQYAIIKKHGAVCSSVKTTGEKFDIIFYHFHRLLFYSGNLLDLGNYPLNKNVQKLIYGPYINHLQDIKNRISIEGKCSDPHGTISNPINFKTFLRILKRIVFIRRHNIKKMDSFIGYQKNINTDKDVITVDKPLKLKILLVHNQYQETSGENSVFNAEHELLKSHGHEIRTLVKSNKLHGFLSRANTGWLFLKSAWNMNSARAVIKEALLFKPEIVHIHNFWFVLSPSIHHYLALKGIVVVQTLHNYRLLCAKATYFRDGKPCEDCSSQNRSYATANRCYRGSFLQTAIINRMIRKSWAAGVWTKDVSAFITLTQFAKDKFVHCGIPQDRIFVKQNFVYSQSMLEIKRKPDQLLYAGRISEEKGVHVLIKAIEGISCQAILCGEGPELYLVPRDKEHIQLKGTVAHEQLFIYMRESAVLVFPSLCYEGMPMVILEAFANGLPVIASRIGGIPEIVQDGVNGLLFDPGDYMQMRSKISSIINNSQLQLSLSNGARQFYENTLTPEINYKKLLSIYESAIHLHGPKNHWTGNP